MATTVTATGTVNYPGTYYHGSTHTLSVTYNRTSASQIILTISLSGGCGGSTGIDGKNDPEITGWSYGRIIINGNDAVTGLHIAPYTADELGYNERSYTSSSIITIEFSYAYRGCSCSESVTIPYNWNPSDEDPTPITPDEPSEDEQHQENPNAVIKSYEYITATGLNALKTKIKTMYANRPLLTTQQKSYAGTALNTNYFQPYDNAEINQIGDLINACLVVNDIPNLKYNDLNNSNGYVNLYENILSDGIDINLLTWLSDAKRDATGNSNDHGCRGACVGICSGGCAGTNEGLEGTNSGCDGCSGACYGCTGCGNKCTGSCGTNCGGGCDGCTGGCYNLCTGGCSGCTDSCDASAAPSHIGVCTTCGGGCSGGCGNKCLGDCGYGCTGGCGASCDFDCLNGCKRGCFGCTNNCGSSCGNCTSCSGSCGIGCAEGCYNGCSEACQTTCKDGCAIDCTSGCYGTSTGGTYT